MEKYEMTDILQSINLTLLAILCVVIVRQMGKLLDFISKVSEDSIKRDLEIIEIVRMVNNSYERNTEQTTTNTTKTREPETKEGSETA